MTTPVEDFAAKLQSGVGALKSGTLRYWGVWFGRPHDNVERVFAISAQGDCMRVEFHGGLVLQVWSPLGCFIDESGFVIREATRVRLEWGNDGAPATFLELTRNGDRFDGTSNGTTVLVPDRGTTAPAVELV